jgi:hypothetical protein
LVSFTILALTFIENNPSFVLAIVSAISLHFGGSFVHTEEIHNFLDLVIDSLLNDCKLENAHKVVNYFNHKNVNLEMIETVLEIARGKTRKNGSSLAENILPKSLYIKLKEFSPYIDEMKEIQAILDKCHLLVHGFKSKGARHYFKLIALHYKIASILQISYDDVVSKSGTEILKLLLVSNRYKIASSFIQLRKLDGQETARVCSMYLYNSFQEYFKSEERVFRTESFIDDYFNEERTTQFDLVKYSMDEFTEFAMMCDPTLMGDHITVMMVQPDCTLRCKIEMIIRAYWCYKIASSLEGIQTLLFTIKTLIDELIDMKEFSLIVRLLISVRDYSELGYIFDVLMKYEQFELILKRNNAEKSSQTQLKMVLSSYLKTKYPNDNDKLTMVYLRFNMYREYGELLMQISQRIIVKIYNALTGQEHDSSLTTLRDVEEQLDRVIGKFSSASDALMKEDCCHLSTKCVSLAALCQLQRNLVATGVSTSFIGVPTKRNVSSYRGYVVLNMSLQEARNFVRNCADFFQALTVANAYDINTISDWIDVLYHQCITMGNIDYFCVFRNHLPTSTLLFREISKKFKGERTQNQKSVKSFVRFLCLCNDFRVQHEIAKDVGLSDEEIVTIVSFTTKMLDLPSQTSVVEIESQ